MQFEFSQREAAGRHRCEARREGDWAIFTCPLCNDFERRMNLKTGKMQTRQQEDSFILHEGFFVPTGLEHTHSLPN